MGERQTLMENMRLQRTLRVAFDFLDNNPKLIEDYISQKEYERIRGYLDSQSLDQYFDNLQAPVVAARDKQEAITLNPEVSGLLELGHSLILSGNHTHLVRQYRQLYDILPQKYRQGLTHPLIARRMNVQELRRLVTEISVVIDFAPFEPPNNQVRPSRSFVYDCSRETGYYTARDGDRARRCRPGQFVSDSLFENSQFPLKNFHTCIKSQGRRGTCVAFAIAAAIEAAYMYENDVAYNLSEQFLFHDAAIRKSFNGRYSYGLNTGLTLGRLKRDSVRIQQERDWSYNRSPDKQDKSGNEFPRSCDGYPSSLMCTNFAFQSEETISGPPWNRVRSYRVPFRPTANRFEITDKTSLYTVSVTPRRSALRSAIGLLNQGVPVIISYRVRDNFMDHDQVKRDGGRVFHERSAGRRGGHAALLIGFVANSELPAGYPRAEEEGYFIMKNSWSTSRGDCGYYYVDFKHARETLWGLHTLDYRKL